MREGVLGRLSHCAIRLHHASEIGLDGVDGGLTRHRVLTITYRVELLLRVGQRPNLLLALGAKIPQVGRDYGDRRIRHQQVNTLGRDVNAMRVKQRPLIGGAVHDLPTEREHAW